MRIVLQTTHAANALVAKSNFISWINTSLIITVMYDNMKFHIKFINKPIIQIHVIRQKYLHS